MKADKIDMQKIIKQMEELYKHRDLKKEIEEYQKIADKLSEDMFWEFFNTGTTGYKVTNGEIEKL